MKILHLFPEDPKFFSAAVDFFSIDGISNEWIIFRDDNGRPAESWSAPFLSFRYSEASTNEAAQTLKSEIHNNDIWFIHYFDKRLFHIVNENASTRPLIIQLWGGDYANSMLPWHRLIDNTSYRRHIHEKSKTHHIPWRFAQIYHTFLWWKDGNFRKYNQALFLAHSVCFLLGNSEEWMFHSKVKSKVANWKVIYSDLKSSDFKPRHNTPEEPMNILLGNSATLSNNHLEALRVISNRKDQINTCTIPLSYGGNREYIDDIDQTARKLLGSKSHALREMMPKKAYFQTLEDCDVIIMNHKRQQALGNILWALNTGRTVYLNSKGVMWKHFKSKGYAVKSLCEIESSRFELISQHDAFNNYQLVQTQWVQDKSQTRDALLRIHS